MIKQAFALFQDLFGLFFVTSGCVSVLLGGFIVGIESPAFGAEPDIIYTWNRQYYGKLNGERRLLYTRSFNRSQLAFADIDGDGVDELFVGKENGTVAFFVNKGTPEQPQFELQEEDYKIWRQDVDDNQHTKRIETSIHVGGNAAPVFVDIDDDGDLDLFIGSKDGSLFFYENQGHKLYPSFELASPLYMGLRPGTNTVVRFADVNADRALDMLVGTGEGKVLLYTNAGRMNKAYFCQGKIDSITTEPNCPGPPVVIDDIRPDIDAAPEWVDWNHDNKLDLVVGKSDGKMNFYVNRGTYFEPKWELESNRFLFLDSGGFAIPRFYDLNRDGFPELFIGTSSSTVIYYENQEVIRHSLESIQEVDWTLFNWERPPTELLSKACDLLGGILVCLPQLGQALNLPDSLTLKGDFNSLANALLKADSSFNHTVPIPEIKATTEGSGVPPKGQGTSPAGQINTRAPSFQANTNVPSALPPAGVQGTPPAAKPGQGTGDSKKESLLVTTRNRLWLVSKNYLEFGEFIPNDRHTVITSGDWNNDGKVDLLLGSLSGRLSAYQNKGTDTAEDWSAIAEPIFAPNQREQSAPTLGDIDGDGDLDLLVGNRAGRLELIRNTGSKQSPVWKIETLFYSQIDVGNNSIPTLWDIDQDGDLDLFVGNSRGRIIFYQNQGNKNTPQFVIKSTRFSKVLVSNNAAPAFFYWGEDPHPDLLIGARNGQIQLVSNNPLPGYPVTQGWQLETPNWTELETQSFSTPHFMDLNKDQKPDLLMGSGNGKVLVWLNGGFEKVADLPPEPAVTTSNTVDKEPEETVVENEDLPEVVVEEELTEEEHASEREVEEPPNIPFDPVYTLTSKKYGDLAFGKRAVPVFFDIEGDNDLDLFVGNKEGEIHQYLNEGTPTAPHWVLVTKKFLDYEGGKNATPLFADLDNDGDLDFLVGNEQGEMTYWENKGSPESAEFVPNPTPFAGVTGGRNVRPAVFDINADGANDVILGNFQGYLRVYLQIRGANGFRMELHHREYMGLDVGLGATPTFADINNSQTLDLIIGSDQGKLFAYNQDTITPNNQWGWSLNKRYFKDLVLPLGCFPVFVDLDQDGDVDMFIGSDEGTIYFYENKAK
ncbi:VCBS repeat-containing protein [Deltaproteobacteria bacterium TL4]